MVWVGGPGTRQCASLATGVWEVGTVVPASRAARAGRPPSSLTARDPMACPLSCPWRLRLGTCTSLGQGLNGSSALRPVAAFTPELLVSPCALSIRSDLGRLFFFVCSARVRPPLLPFQERESISLLEVLTNK